jgi:hypothetical protein
MILHINVGHHVAYQALPYANTRRLMWESVAELSKRGRREAVAD